MILVLAAIATVAAAQAGGRAVVVSAPAGIVSGAQEGAVRVFRGIPFAAPPVGELRWKDPQRLHRWKGVRPATAFAPACPQKGVSMPGEARPRTDEDCLYLNLWTPARGTALPVIVWLHGGGFTNGSASMPLYRGDRLARRGVIVVTAAYRLGPLGYLAHPELTAESPRRTSGNYGLLDQVAALRWVRDNIAAFGGDPARITVAGQSAGATSVSLLLASPAAKGLFSRAIAQSGGLFEPVQLAPNYLLARAEQEGEAYARSVGARSLAELRRLPVGRLLGGTAGAVSHPVIDHAVLPRTPYDAFTDGRQNDVPILLGSNADEARSLVREPGSIRAATFEADVTRAWGDLPPALLAAYPRRTDTEAVTARLGLERDLRFGWDMWAWARLQAMKSAKPTYFYHFENSPPFPASSVYRGWGPSHFAELWYMFDHLDQDSWAWTRADRRLADTMARYWVNFARDGNPNGAGLPAWPRFTSTHPQTQFLAGVIRTGTPAHLASLSVFDTTYSAVRGRSFGAATTVKNSK